MKHFTSPDLEQDFGFTICNVRIPPASRNYKSCFGKNSEMQGKEVGRSKLLNRADLIFWAIWPKILNKITHLAVNNVKSDDYEQFDLDNMCINIDTKECLGIIKNKL